jgi:hypothetical protein
MESNTNIKKRPWSQYNVYFYDAIVEVQAITCILDTINNNHHSLFTAFPGAFCSFSFRWINVLVDRERAIEGMFAHA